MMHQTRRHFGNDHMTLVPNHQKNFQNAIFGFHHGRHHQQEIHTSNMIPVLMFNQVKSESIVISIEFLIWVR